MNDTGLKDRVVLVTGATHGIGAAIARAFADEWAAVFVTYLRLVASPAVDNPGDDTVAPRSSPGEAMPGEALYQARRAFPADDVIRAFADRGGRVAAMEADLSDPATIPMLFDRAEAALGPVEVIVNNAAAWEADTFIPQPLGTRDRLDRTLHTVTARGHDHHFAVNSRAAALLMAEFTRRHVARGAVGAHHHGEHRWRVLLPWRGVLRGSKAALESYTRSAAGELGRYGITANTVSPGPIQTGGITLEMEAEIATTIPLGRVGQPDDVADVVIFLASEQARWLTGQVLYVGGGHTMPI